MNIGLFDKFYDSFSPLLLEKFVFVGVGELDMDISASENLYLISQKSKEARVFDVLVLDKN
jgi:hypothetical protein